LALSFSLLLFAFWWSLSSGWRDFSVSAGVVSPAAAGSLEQVVRERLAKVWRERERGRHKG
jgi:hypothetical protein